MHSLPSLCPDRCPVLSQHSIDFDGRDLRMRQLQTVKVKTLTRSGAPHVAAFLCDNYHPLRG